MKLLLVVPPNLLYKLNRQIEGLKSSGVEVTTETDPIKAIELMTIGAGFEECAVVANGVFMCRQIAHSKRVLIPTTYFWISTKPDLNNVKLIKLEHFDQIWPGKE